MVTELYDSLLTLLSIKDDLDMEEAEEILDEAISQIAGIRDGTNKQYETYGEVLSDYLDLGETYVGLFLDYLA